MLRSGHPSPSFRWSRQRQSGDSNRAGTPGKLKPNASEAGEFHDPQRHEQGRRPPPPVGFSRLGLSPGTVAATDGTDDLPRSFRFTLEKPAGLLASKAAHA
jgi:hypothetical protein